MSGINWTLPDAAVDGGLLIVASENNVPLDVIAVTPIPFKQSGKKCRIIAFDIIPVRLFKLSNTLATIQIQKDGCSGDIVTTRELFGIRDSVGLTLSDKFTIDVRARNISFLDTSTEVLNFEVLIIPVIGQIDCLINALGYFED